MPIALGNYMNIDCEGEKLNNKDLHSEPDVYWEKREDPVGSVC